MKIEIKNRFNGNIIIQGEEENLKTFLEKNRDANLVDADLRYSDLRYSNLAGSDLRGCDLRGSNLVGSNLVGSNLTGSDLRKSNLASSDLRGCDLRCSKLVGCNLRDSNLAGSDLRDSYIGSGFKYSLNETKYTQKVIPIQLFLSHYIVIIFSNTIQIGCKHYTIKEWKNFTDDQIDAMDKGKSLKWWNKYKDIIFKLIDKENENK